MRTHFRLSLVAVAIVVGAMNAGDLRLVKRSK